MRFPAYVTCAAILLAAASPGSLDAPAAVAFHPSVQAVGSSPASLPMQADPGAPIWAALQGLGLAPSEWALLLTEDADRNGRTDFLDVAATVAAPVGLQATPVEVLVHADAGARAALLAEHPGAVGILGFGVALTVPLDQVPHLQRDGVSLVAWEPRAFATSSANPAGGSPAAMAQHTISHVGTAWSANRHGNNVRIAILDTGVDAGHQSLSQSGKVPHWKDCVNNISPAYDDHGHGTHVASIAAGNDSTDFKGVADQAKVTGIKILDLNGSGTIAWFQCGVNFVLTGGTGGAKTAEVASMSAGLSVPPLGITTLNGGELDVFGWDAVADQIPAGNVPFMVAAGNWVGTAVEFGGLDETTHAGVNGVNQVSSPGFSRNVLTVGAIDSLRAPGTFTALGPGKGASFKPDVVAHGVATWGALEGTTSLYEQWSGTSMATPVAAGVVALLVGKTAGLTHVSYENAMRNGATPACVYATSPTACTVNQPPVSFVSGRGVVRAPNSLTFV